jgi:Ca-activated chloride channel family protein
MQIREAVLWVKGEKKRVSLQGIKIEAEVLDLACSTRIVQTYRNTEKKAIEAVYCFPVEEGASVNDFEIQTDGRILKGIVEEREKAFETYDRALEQGDASFLLDQESGDILYLSVGNIKPDQEVIISIRYVKRLSIVDGIVRLQIPTTVSPRYAPADTDPLKVDRITPDYDLDVPYRIDLRVKVKSEFMEEATSPSHRITTSKDTEYTVVELGDGSTRLDRDFVLEIEAAQPDKPVCTWSTHDNGDRACMFRFTPQFDELQGEHEQRSEILFVLDCSGSMQGSSIAEAKEALELSLRALSEGDLFNIVRFGSSYQTYRPTSQKYSSQTLEKALHYVQGIDADMGGTEIYRPLKDICSLPTREGFNRDVLLLTDGEVANSDDVIHLVSSSVEKNQFLRFFTIGIGYGASHYLVNATARAGRGACEMIMPGETIQPKVLRQLARMGQPSLTDISLRFKAVKAEPASSLPPLFEGDSCTVFSKLNAVEDGARVTLNGSYLGKPYKWSARLKDVGHDDIVPTLWALSRIEHLKTNGTGGSNQRVRREQRLKREIIELGLRYNLLTEYTSFVAVEERAEGEKQRGRPEYRRIPVMLTRDWHGISGDVIGGALSADAFSGERSEMVFFEPDTQITLNRPARESKAVARIWKQEWDRLVYKQQFMKIDSSGTEKKDKVKPWYLALLKTQQADGSFAGLDLLSRHLGIPLKKLKEFSKLIEDVPSDQQETALSTWLSVKLLSSDAEAAGVATRALKKAEKWLSQHDRENLTVGAIPIGEAFQKHFGRTFN